MTENPYEAPQSVGNAIKSGKLIPEEIAKKIRHCWIAGVISSVLTIIFILLAMGGTNPLGMDPTWAWGDVVVILGLSYGVYKESRVCAVLLLLFFALNKIILWYETGKPSGIFVALIFFVIYIQGVIGTFELHTWRKKIEFEEE